MILRSPQTATKIYESSYGSCSRERSESSGRETIKISKDNRNIVRIIDSLKTYLIDKEAK